MLREISNGLVDIVRPPRRITVSEAAAEALYVSESQKWDAELVPYMIRPMDETANRSNKSVCFVGPARTGKTLGLILGRWVYSVTCHPQDFAVVHSSQDLARDLSNRELRRLHLDSPSIRSAMTGRRSDDNTFDKVYKSGVMAVIAWPSITQLASRTIPVMLLTDYDRWPREVGGRSPIVQAQKRTETAGSLAMTVIESSPGTEVSPDHDIEPVVYELGKALKHDFPPTVSGVFANICEIYNAGTREWWYVPCLACGEYYPQNASIERFSWGDSDDPVIAAKSAGTICCWCGAIHPETTKQHENANGVWLAEGEVIDCYGKITGESRKGHVDPSFSLGGGAAAYQNRQSIVKKYLQALQSANDTGDESTLKGVVNDDVGCPHTSIYVSQGRAATPIQKRAEPVEQWTVPEGVRFLMAAVDVQNNRFVPQVQGFGLNRNRWLIDHYNLSRSEARPGDGVKPAIYDEDWDLLLKLIEKSYPLADGSGRYMRVAGVLCDLGGAEGVTDKALAFYRRLPLHLRNRFRLIKGADRATAPLVEQRFPDTSARKDRGASRGDVPVYFINSNRMKDRVNGDLMVPEPGPGYCHFASWLPDWFYKQLTREKRGKDGKWSSASKNEAWDLMCYCEAGAIMGVPFSGAMKGINRPGFWDNPPSWAKDWESNPMVFTKDVSTETPKPANNKTNSRLQNKPTFINRPTGTPWIR